MAASRRLGRSPAAAQLLRRPGRSLAATLAAAHGLASVAVVAAVDSTAVAVVVADAVVVVTGKCFAKEKPKG